MLRYRVEATDADTLSFLSAVCPLMFLECGVGSDITHTAGDTVEPEFGHVLPTTQSLITKERYYAKQETSVGGNLPTDRHRRKGTEGFGKSRVVHSVGKALAASNRLINAATFISRHSRVPSALRM